MTGGHSAPDGSDGPHVLVDDIEELDVAEADRHHLGKVLRLRDGDSLTAGDGAGRWRRCRWATVLEPVEDIRVVEVATPRLGVGFALIKGGRPELVVQKLVELGIDDIRLFSADRSVVEWDSAKAVRNTDRLRRVAREAVMQCRRVWLPEIHPPSSFSEVAALAGAAMADRGGDRVELDTPLVLVGPEGGWSDTENQAELPRVRVGGPVLRAETAAIAAGVLLTARRLGLA